MPKVYPDPFLDRMRSLLGEYVRYCEAYEYETGLFHPTKFNDDGTCEGEKQKAKGIEPTFIGFIKYIGIK